jgi:hypothetical protein
VEKETALNPLLKLEYIIATYSYIVSLLHGPGTDMPTCDVLLQNCSAQE